MRFMEGNKGESRGAGARVWQHEQMPPSSPPQVPEASCADGVSEARAPPPSHSRAHTCALHIHVVTAGPQGAPVPLLIPRVSFWKVSVRWEPDRLNDLGCLCPSV